MNIVLAHGILGFGHVFGVPLRYFNGVADHIQALGHQVIEPPVNAIGSIDARGDQLANAILSDFRAADEVHIIAHSMGGLDSRYALNRYPELASKVKTLVAIGTPHLGSPVADAIVNPDHPLSPHIPSFLKDWMGGPDDLTTKKCSEFDQNNPDVGGVRYIDVAGDASRDKNGLLLFELTEAIGNLYNDINDGVVTKKSALRKNHIHLDDWPVDHAGEIGWNTDSFFPLLPPVHLRRYEAIVAML